MSAVVRPAVLATGSAVEGVSDPSARRRAGWIVASGAVGAVAWSGLPMALALSCAAPLLIVGAATRRAVALRAGAYFLGATWPIVPAAAVFFGTDAGGMRGALLGVMAWMLIAALNVLPWLIAAPSWRLGRPLALLLGLGLPALPPLSLVGLASPLAGLGWWVPGTAGGGVALYVVLATGFVAVPRSALRGDVVAAGVLAVMLSHAAETPGAVASGRWVAVPTQLGAARPVARTAVDAEAMETLRRAALRSDARVIVLPESLFPHWSAAHDVFLRPLWRELAARNQVVMFGVQRGNPSTGLLENLVLVRGRERGEYAQHLPVPISMYRLGAAGSVPLRWQGSYVTQITEERVALLVCWEQLLIAPMLTLSVEAPDRLVGLSNLYFARGTPVAAIQRSTLQSWARLFGVPWLHAINE